MLGLCKLALWGLCSFSKCLFSYTLTRLTVVQRWHSKHVTAILKLDRNFCQVMLVSVVPNVALVLQT